MKMRLEAAVSGLAIVLSVHASPRSKNRSIQKCASKLNHLSKNMPWQSTRTTPPADSLRRRPPGVFSYCEWELYKVNDDFSEPNDVAAREPKKLRELEDPFWAEAAKYITIAPRLDFKERTLKATRP